MLGVEVLLDEFGVAEGAVRVADVCVLADGHTGRLALVTVAVVVHLRLLLLLLALLLLVLGGGWRSGRHQVELVDVNTVQPIVRLLVQALGGHSRRAEVVLGADVYLDGSFLVAPAAVNQVARGIVSAAVSACHLKILLGELLLEVDGRRVAIDLVAAR